MNKAPVTGQDIGKDTGQGDHPPPDVRFLKILVTVLTVTMIAGLLTLIALFVTRLPGRNVLPPLPKAITLPDGTTPEAFTRGRGWIGVVTKDGQFLIYDADTGALRQSVRVNIGR
jgi:hypothetical protein